MAFPRPPITYARRKSLRAPSSNTLPSLTGISSSPLEDLSPSRHDVTLSEMSRRMKKRSRQVTSAKQSAVDLDLTERLAKKLRRPSQSSLYDGVEDALAFTVPSTPVNQHDRSLPLDTQRIYDSLFETPYQLRPSDESLIKSYVEPLASADSLSPTPVARHMLSRTSSRNLKENSNRLARQRLASPFTSRPVSRNSSPHKTVKTPGRRPLHTKSRTLSSSFVNKPVKSASVHKSNDFEKDDAGYDSIFSSTAPGSALSSSAHSRTGSIPAMPSNLFDHISPQEWLVPAKALSRSPPSLEDMELDDWTVKHTSFYLDTPIKISTPPRRRRTTITLHNHRTSASLGKSQSRTESMDLTDVVTATEDEIARGNVSAQPVPEPIQPRRRRRTVVHMSSDSIFSSALDFSAYMTEFSPTKVHGSASPRHSASSSGEHAAGTAGGPAAPLSLDPAFSPDLAPLQDSQEPHASPKTPAGSAHVSRTMPFSPEASRPGPSQRALPLQTPGRRELDHMFRTLDLSEPCAHDSVGGGGSEGGFEKTIRSEQLPRSSRASAEPYDLPEPESDINLVGDPASDSRVGNGERVALRAHGRKRGDTIRASDYARPARPSLPHESASAARSSNPRMETKKTVAASGTRRTRSGTVTLAKPQTNGRAQATRRAANLPTIKMRVNDKPLSPQASDDEDDELLLTRGVSMQDG
ncbi:uncharacterized protein PHACADRAFT_213433 [Phanerochaete carnosa HHB-10118-sp]|uniref:Uncharacterized protein n=1 Tax=Phanerochaete carnosa (strain HHB-10118-sp) TaxID=650164 RepID=K5VUM3_PHACS|nr:uncharacterized protein PHACADRAFT_213433 [Phanerochaete carnosa HHB-10118-sp]EKM50510.1 hypothetical protein PHACADRAFT_213433 [Phanerochaete carnosa HHB-10118-sp]